MRVVLLVGVGLGYAAVRRWITVHVVLMNVRRVENPLSVLSGLLVLLPAATAVYPTRACLLACMHIMHKHTHKHTHTHMHTRTHTQGGSS